MEQMAGRAGVVYRCTFGGAENRDTLVSSGNVSALASFTAGPTQQSISGETITFTATPAQTGTLHAVALADNSPTPNPADVKLGSGKDGADSLAQTHIGCTAGVAITIQFVGITEARVDCYFAVESNGATGTVVKRDVTMNSGIPVGWSTADIGSVSVAGSADYADGLFTIKGDGGPVFGLQDAFRYVYKQVSGDGDFVARVMSMAGGTKVNGGIMMRSSLSPDAPHMSVIMRLTDTDGVRVHTRTTQGGTTTSTPVTIVTKPRHLFLVRKGASIGAFYQNDNLEVIQLNLATMPFGDNYYIGMFAAAQEGTLLTAIFDRAEFKPAALPPNTPPSFTTTLETANITSSSFRVPFSLNEAGSAWAVVVANNATAPSATQVRAGQSASGAVATDAAGPVSVAGGSEGVLVLDSGMTAGTSYDCYVVAADTAGLLQASPTKVDVTLSTVGGGGGGGGGDATETKFTRLMSFPVSANDATDWQTAIAEKDGSVYMGYLTPGMATVVSRRSPTGNITTGTILANTPADKNHRLPSVTVDNSGYIHCVYNMHHDPWAYKVSTNPHDVSSWTDVTGTLRNLVSASENRITYPAFFRDLYGELYVTFRQGVGPFRDNGQAAGCARYNNATQRWTMLGGTSYRHGQKTICWNDSSRYDPTFEGGKQTGYQTFRPRLFFDSSNRMHMSWEVFGFPTSQDNSHIMYAYSDDRGDTWYKADGNRIAELPITIARGDVVATSNPGSFSNTTAVGVNNQGRPIVAWYNRGTGQRVMSTWNGTQWTTPVAIPAAGGVPQIHCDHNGYIVLGAQGGFNRSKDGGATWTKYTTESKLVTFDRARAAPVFHYVTYVNGNVEGWSGQFA